MKMNMTNYSLTLLVALGAVACSNQQTEADAPQNMQGDQSGDVASWETTTDSGTRMQDDSDMQGNPTMTEGDTGMDQGSSLDQNQAQPANVSEGSTGSLDQYQDKEPLRTLRGEAGYYGEALEGNPTASGETFDPSAHTAAMSDLPLGSVVRVARAEDPSISVIVRVNDRMPDYPNRIIDLSTAAAEAINLRAPEGVTDVRVEVLEMGEGRQAQASAR